CPPTVEFLPRHLSSFDVRVVDIRDLELAAPRRPKRSNYVVHLTVIHVDTNDGIIGFRNGWFFFNAHDLAPVKLRDTKTRRIRYLLENDLRTVALIAIRADCRSNISFDNIIAEDHAHWI